MKNRYEIQGNQTTIYLRRRDGSEIPTIIDTEDLQKVAAVGTWAPLEVRRTGTFYAVHNEFKAGRRLCATLLHRVVMDASGVSLIDHINGDKLDNRKANLRFANNALNSLNRTIKERGVYPVKGGWTAVIYTRSVQVNLGKFETEREARIAFAGALTLAEKLAERMVLEAVA